jgi:hypothetical protein
MTGGSICPLCKELILRTQKLCYERIHRCEFDHVPSMRSQKMNQNQYYRLMFSILNHWFPICISFLAILFMISM